MKPTQEIVELARKLKELGYDKKHDYGDFVSTEHGVCVVSEAYKILERDGLEVTLPGGWTKDAVEVIPIPSLEQALDWLSGKFEALEVWVNTKNYRWYCRWKNEHFTWGKTPHEACLKAMIKVLQ